MFEDEAPPIALLELDPEATASQPSVSFGRRVALTTGVGALMGLLLIVIWAIRSDQPENPVVDRDDSSWESIEFPEGVAGGNELIVWTGDEIVFWGGQEDDVEETPTGEPAMAYNPETREWRTLPASPKKPATGAAGVWTGNELIICCGTGNQSADLATTVAYDPAANTWRRLADAPISGSFTEAMWTGEQMLVVALGGVAGYDPDTDSWTTFPPPADGDFRLGDIAWTGEELIIWSREVERQVHPGIALSPTSGTWRTLPDPPAWPAAPDIVWTGEQLVLWGGLPAAGGGSERAVGSVYDPDTNSWSVMSEALPEPEAFEGNLGSQAMVWTGERVLVSTGALGSGVDPERSLLLAYDPHSDTWKLLDQALLPFRGGELLVMGDRIVIRSDRLYISPVGWAPEGEIITADYWSTPTTTSVPMTTSTTQPEIRETPPGWTITEIPFTVREGSAYATGGGWFFVWGGAPDRAGTLRQDGMLVDVESGQWTAIPDAPISGRFASSVVWTGAEFVVFGGHSFDESFVDGASFNPETLEWRPISAAPLSLAANPAAVWDGARMIVWMAGEDSAFAERPSPSIGQLASYDPASDLWAVMPSPDLEIVDADLMIHNDSLLLVGGPSMRDGAGGLTRSLYGTQLSRSESEWSDPVLGPGVDSARLLVLPDGRPGVLVDRGGVYVLETDTWEQLEVEPSLSPGFGEGCWWDVGASSNGGESYLKLCGFDLRFIGPTMVEVIVEPDDYGSTSNLYASAFIADVHGRLLVFGDSDLPSSDATSTALFGVYSP